MQTDAKVNILSLSLLLSVGGSLVCCTCGWHLVQQHTIDKQNKVALLHVVVGIRNVRVQFKVIRLVVGSDMQQFTSEFGTE
jgi:uncharacterized membrane protein YdcZ (DUF606 family)